MCWECGKETIFLLLPPKTYNIKPHTKHIFANVLLLPIHFECRVWIVVKDHQPAYASIIIIFERKIEHLLCVCVCCLAFQCHLYRHTYIRMWWALLLLLLLLLLFMPFIFVYSICTQTSHKPKFKQLSIYIYLVLFSCEKFISILSQTKALCVSAYCMDESSNNKKTSPSK